MSTISIGGRAVCVPILLIICVSLLPESAAALGEGFKIYYQQAGGIGCYDFDKKASETVLLLSDKRMTLEDFDITGGGALIAGVQKGNVVLYDTKAMQLTRLTEDGSVSPSDGLSYSCPRFAGASGSLVYIAHDPLSNPPVDSVWLVSYDGVARDKLPLRKAPAKGRIDGVLFNPPGDIAAIEVVDSETDRASLFAYGLKTKTESQLVSFADAGELYFGESVEDFGWMDGRQILALVSSSGPGGYYDYSMLVLDADMPGREYEWKPSYAAGGAWVQSLPRQVGEAFCWMRMGAPDEEADTAVYVSMYKGRLLSPDARKVGELRFTGEQFDAVSEIVPLPELGMVAVFRERAKRGISTYAATLVDWQTGSEIVTIGDMLGTRAIVVRK